MLIRTKPCSVLGLIVVGWLFWGSAGAEPNTAPVPPSWQNPALGLTLDAVIDAHNAEGAWKSPGATLRGAELIISANIDPYALLLGNVLISEHGAELHEAFAEFPFLPLNVKTKAGLMLANFGRWNRFHLHAMPFVSEPRIYKEYAGGMLALKGIELSWMPPIDHYVEVTLSAYDRIQGHSHDVDPVPDAPPASALSVEQIAEQIGAQKHGSHWHGSSGEILYEEDLLALATGSNSKEPLALSGNRRPPGFAYGGRLTTALEIGAHISIDAGISGLYQQQFKKSQRLDNQTYQKLVYGTDITLFWHPLSANKYRHLQLGTELLGTYEGFERLDGDRLFKELYNRWGAFSWIAVQLCERWQTGAYAERFASNDFANTSKLRYGSFVTLSLSHYQYLRLELSRFNYPSTELDGVNRLMLQYDATIGHHTHGRLR